MATSDGTVEVGKRVVRKERAVGDTEDAVIEGDEAAIDLKIGEIGFIIIGEELEEGIEVADITIKDGIATERL